MLKFFLVRCHGGPFGCRGGFCISSCGLPRHFYFMGTPIGLKLARVILRVANADLVLDGISYPCHHAAFDRGNPLYDIGHSKKVTLASRIEVPLFNLDGTENGFDRKVKTGLRARINSRERKSLSHNIRVSEPISFDEGTVAFHVTDTRR